jgi:hypothetical protein
MLTLCEETIDLEWPWRLPPFKTNKTQQLLEGSIDA